MAEREAVRKRNKRKSDSYFDYSLLFVVLFLLVFGFIMIYSASSYNAFQDYGDPAYYMKKQLLAALIGLVLMVVVSKIPYHFFERFALAGFIFSLLLIPVVKTPLGVNSHGATRWIKIPGIGLNLQPAEIAKLCMILFLAVLVSKLGRNVDTFKGFAIMVCAPLLHCAFIYLFTKNLSSAIIVFGISFLMLFVASSSYKVFFALGGGGIAAVTALVLYIVNKVGTDGGFRSERIIVWLNPESQAQDKGFQTLQALYAIGSGGTWGKGLGQSMQKLSFLPESQNDMIFSIICEELGLFGGICVISMFIMLLWRMLVIANNAPDLYGAMLVVGVMGHIAIQAVLNIAVVTNTIPNTGISLPFISYGGSSVMFLLIEIGLVMSVSRGIRLADTQ
ncbi:MAG: FtsW/RodA/SpoVE family cell cycle protein [Acetatifactor sp.]|nr:FtsW/RodA/SpoVE family cell cycle protein [Acetatifactor sp.]